MCVVKTVGHQAALGYQPWAARDTGAAGAARELNRGESIPCQTATSPRHPPGGAQERGP